MSDKPVSGRQEWISLTVNGFSDEKSSASTINFNDLPITIVPNISRASMVFLGQIFVQPQGLFDRICKIGLQSYVRIRIGLKNLEQADVYQFQNGQECHDKLGNRPMSLEEIFKIHDTDLL